MPSPMPTRRSAILLAVESTYGVAPTFNPATDGFFVDAPDFTQDIQVLQRKVVQSLLSRCRHLTGYLLAKIKFNAEMSFNALANAGTGADEPIIGRMFRGCSMAMTASSAASVDTVYPLTPEAGAACTFTGSATGIDPIVTNIGKNPGSRMFVSAPTAQYTGLTYKDRTGIVPTTSFPQVKVYIVQNVETGHVVAAKLTRVAAQTYAKLHAPAKVSLLTADKLPADAAPSMEQPKWPLED